MNLKKLVSIGLCIFVIVSILPISFVRAAGVSVTLGTASMAISTAYNSTVSFVPGTALSTGATVTLYYPSAYTDTSLVLGDVTLTKTGDANFTSAVTVVSTGSDTATFTLTTSAPTDTSNPFIITFANSHLLTSGTGANYTFAVTTDNLAGGGDYGAALQYVGNTNQVKVTAIVKPILTFAIRNTADSAEQATVSGLKTCALGVLTTTTVSTCDYRLKVGTNSVSGYTISYISDTNLTNGTYNMTNAAAGSNGSSPASAGTEQYGVLLTAGSNTVGTVSRGTDFLTTTTNIYQITKTSGPNTMISSNGPNAPSGTDTTNTTLVQHRATIDSATRTGNYNHTVSYTVSATF